MLDVRAERHQALGLLAVLGVVTTQRNELLANRTSAVRLPLAVLRMLDHPFHLLTARQATVRVATLTCVDQRLDAPLDGLFARFLRVRLLDIGRGRTVVQVETKLLHLVRMADLLLARETQIEVLRREMEVSGCSIEDPRGGGKLTSHTVQW